MEALSNNPKRVFRVPKRDFPLPHAWLVQQLDQMEAGISAGKTRRRKIQSARDFNVDEDMLKREVIKRKWKVAQIGNDYVFAPGDYTIRPIV